MTPNQPSKKNAYLSRNALKNRLTEETDTTIAVEATEPVEELPEPSIDDLIKSVVDAKIEAAIKAPTAEDRIAYRKAPKTLAESGINLNDLFKGF